jgi:N-methylhydantoinase B/oxoprolinase/acetone carboxylase alpha subunit
MKEIKPNPITVEVIRNSLESAVAETGATISKLAHSLLFAECKDFSVGILTADADLLALAEYIPAHQGGMKTNADAILRIVGKDNLFPGDVVMTNDPYLGGLHSQDLLLMKPLFFEEELIAFAGCVAHRTDMGGMVPGSLCLGATEIYQEAIRFPCVKLVNEGVINEEIMRIYLTNVRLPEDQKADTTAQLAALDQCEKAVVAIVEKYGLETFKACAQEILDISERRARLEVEKIPDGIYPFCDYTEHDAITDRDWAVRGTVEIRGSDIYVDFTGTDEQAAGLINCAPYVVVPKTWQSLMYWADPTIPKNQGLYRPFKEIKAPKGTIVNPNFPAPVGGCPTDTAAVVLDAVLSAFTEARPERGWATWSNANSTTIFIGVHPETGKQVIYSALDGLAVGGGARAHADGWPASQVEASAMMIPSVEVTEQNIPLRYIRREFVTDYAGDGKFRGGTGVIVEYEVLTPMTVNYISLRHRHPSPGAQGGTAGGPQYAKAIINGQEVEMPQKTVGLKLGIGDRIIVCNHGGGGFGNPMERAPELVEKDLEDGFISEEKAIIVYGYSHQEC